MNYPSLSQWSFAKGTSGVNPPELYISLWLYSGVMISGGGNAPGSGSNTVIYKGNTNTTSIGSSNSKLHTLNANWSLTQQYAFEACLYAGTSANSYVVYAELWDMTSNTGVSGSQISATSSSTASPAVFRSGKFTLTPGHSYGVTVWSANTTPQITDASLIVFPQ